MTVHDYNPYRRSGEEWLKLHEQITADNLQSARGTILEAELDMDAANDGRHYAVRIQYRYRHQKQDYTENAIFPCADRQEAVELATYYRKGATVGVFFPPDRPHQSQLGPHVPASSTVVMLTVGLLLFASLITVVLLLGLMTQSS